MIEWQELGQSVFIGLIFAFLVAKLLSIVFQFKDENFKLVREENLPLESDFKAGVESSDLDEEFSAATAFIAASVSSSSKRVSNEVQLELYGLYKIATEGPCNTPQPSALQLSKRAKWNAWQRLGAMSLEEAMQNYISMVTELYPSWATGSTFIHKDGDNDGTSSATKETMGPVFSTFVHDEDSDNER